MEHPGKALPEGAAGIGFAFGTSGLKAFAASGAASPVRCPCPAIAPRDWISFLRALTASQMRFLSENDVRYASQKKSAYKRLWCVLANFIRRLYLGLKALPEGFSEANVDKCGKNVDNLWITLEKLLKTCTSTCSLE